MKRVLFLCNTHFQCMVAITLKYTRFKDDKVDIIVTDFLMDSYKLYKKLKKSGVFNQVLHVEICNYLPKVKNFKYYIRTLAGEILPGFLGRKVGITYKYDCYFTYNNDLLAESICYLLKKSNSNIEICLYDEGYSTYTTIYKKILFRSSTRLNILRKISSFISNRKYIVDYVNDLYLLDPDLLCWNPPFKIQKIKKPGQNSNEYISMLNYIFGYGDLKDSYNKKVVFFEESYYWDNRPIKDIEMLEYISNRFGKENIIVKLHPRNRVNRFKHLNYQTNLEIGIPWEIIVMNMDNTEGKIFVTYTSGSVISYRILFDKRITSIMLFKCMKEENSNVNKSTIEFFEKFKTKYNENFYIPSDEKELERIISNLI